MVAMTGRFSVQTFQNPRLIKITLHGNVIMMLLDILDKSAQLYLFFSFTNTGKILVYMIRWVHNQA